MAHRRRLLAVTLLVGPLSAQWPTVPTTNLPIADRAGFQAAPNIAAAPHGGCYVAWFDGWTANYEVRLQRLDAEGNELWPHGGVLVSDQPQQSALTDWDIVACSTGGVVLTFCDIRNGGDLDVYAYRFDENGAPVWGHLGVRVSNNIDYETSPRVAECSDGEFVIAWTRIPAAGDGSIEIQRLTAAGSLRYFPNPMSVVGGPGTRPGFVDVAATGDAREFVVTWVSDVSAIGVRHVHAQKFDDNGQPLWGSAPLPVFDAASVPFAHQPRVVGDGSGGAWIAWHYPQGVLFTTRVQRVTAAGNEVFVHGGIDVSTEPGVSRLDPSLALDTDSGDLLCAFGVRNSAETQWGVAVQRVSAAGARLWTDAGVGLAPLDSTPESGVRLVPFAGGAIVAWLAQQGMSPAHTTLASRVDSGGTVSWPGAPLTVSSTVSEKLDLVADVTPSGVGMFVWTDRRADSGDVFAQNVNADGSLGAKVPEAIVYGSGVNPAGSMTVAGLPRLGTTFELLVDNPAATQAPGTVPFVVFSLAADPAYPSGTAVPVFGMSAAGAAGELLLDPAQVLGAFQAPPWTGAPSALEVSVPLAPTLVGGVLHAQGVLFDPSPGAAIPRGLTDAARLRVGF